MITGSDLEYDPSAKNYTVYLRYFKKNYVYILILNPLNIKFEVDVMIMDLNHYYLFSSSFNENSESPSPLITFIYNI